MFCIVRNVSLCLPHLVKESIEHWYSFDCRVINVFVVSEFRIDMLCDFWNVVFVNLQNDVGECCLCIVWVFVKTTSVYSVNFIQFAFLQIVYEYLYWRNLKVVTIGKRSELSECF